MTRPPSDARRRLSRAADFDAVYRRGRSQASRHLVVYAFPREPGDEDPPRLGISTSRRLGGAVERNRLKRRLREAFLRVESEVPRGVDFAVIARPGLAAAAEERGFDWLVEELRALVARPVSTS